MSSPADTAPTRPADEGSSPTVGANPASDPASDQTQLLEDSPGVLGRRRRRPIISYVVTVLVLVTLNFAIPRLMPGDPIDALLSSASPNYVADDSTRATLASYYDLDKPVTQQYLSYLDNLVHGDLGTSIYSNRPVAQEIGERIPWTALLIVVSMLLSFLIGLPAGIHSAWKFGRKMDRGLLGFFMSVQNLPIYFVGAMALLLFSAKLGIVPLGGARTPFASYGPLHNVLDIAHHLALPALLLAFEFASFQYLVMRSAMVSELGSDYLLGARTRGLRERRLKYRYAGRNALLPVVTVIGIQFSLAVTSIIFIEQLFSYPGLGQYMFNSVFVRDYPAIQGTFLLLTFSVVTVNLLVDLLYRRLDPRTSA